jgi:outer membrane protein assembly factor BamB
MTHSVTSGFSPLIPSYETPVPTVQPRLRLGLMIVIAQWLVIKIPEWFAPQSMVRFKAMMGGPMIGALAVIIWWMALSRLPWRVRWTGLIAFLAGVVIAFALGDSSMRMGLIVVALPLATTAWAIWAFIGWRMGEKVLRIGLITIPVLIGSGFTLIRMEGLDGSIHFSVAWRWRATPEKRYLASLSARSTKQPAMPTSHPAALTAVAGDWPGFRGAARDGLVTGTSIKTDWSQHPPEQVWRHGIGPGWSSFCVVGDRVFTQEQRGKSEMVVCFDLATGQENWAHGDDARFEEAIAGAGPRATPTFAEGKIYSLGGKGRLNCLDALTGKLIWSRDPAAESHAPLPTWGFASSPLVANGLVTVITGGKDQSVTAYHADSGEPAWAAGNGWSFASPHLARLDGVEQLLFVTSDGVSSLDPLTGSALWQHTFKLSGGASRAIQPTILNGDSVLLGAAFGVGTRRIHLSHADSKWKDDSVWTSRALKPYYNDLVVHHDELYGFDGSTFTSVSAATGQTHWRTNGYGNGQVLLLVDQNLLLILSETGEAALVDAKPDSYHEIGRFQAVNGKTWNHPVVAHGKLLVRNGEEIACYQVGG